MTELLYIVMVICSSVQPDRCLTVTDTRGPYDTLERCVERREEMLRDGVLKGAVPLLGFPPRVTWMGLCGTLKEVQEVDPRVYRDRERST